MNGFGLAKCCEDVPLDAFPATATTVHFEFFSEQETEDENGAKRSVTNVIHLENVEKLKPKTVPEIMRDLVREYNVPESKQVESLTIPNFFRWYAYWGFALDSSVLPSSTGLLVRRLQRKAFKCSFPSSGTGHSCLHEPCSR